MRRITLKWLLGGVVLLAAMAIATMAALTTAPTAVDILSPTNLGPFYRAQGSVVRVDFTYTSNPTNLPQETTGTVEVWTAGGGTRVAYAQKDLSNGTDVFDYINVTLPSLLSEGYYDVRVHINNSDGGPATDEEPGAVLVDNSAPDPVTDLAVREDDDGGLNNDSSPDGYLNDTSPTLNWTEPDDNGATPSGIEEYVIKLVKAAAGTVFDWTETHNADTTYTITGPLGEGTYTFYLKARDKAGNESAETTEIFTVDTTPLDAPTMNPEPPYTAGTTNTVSWTNPPGACGVEIAIDEDDNQANGFLRSERSIYLDPEEPPTSTELSGLEDGHQYWYYARSQDLAGNWSAWSTAVTSTQDATTPDVSVTAPADGVATSDTTPDFTADATDGGSGVASVKFEYSSNGGTDWVAISTDDTSPYAADWGLVTLPDGSIILRATATNGAGLTSQDQVTITVDTSAPEIDVTAPADGVATSDTTPDFTANATDGGSGVASVKFEYSSNGGADWVAINTDYTSPYAADWGSVTLPDGSIILRATATNGAGLTSQDQVTITVDTSAPEIDVTAPADGTKTSDTTPDFTADATDGGSGVASVKFEYSSNGGTDWVDISTDDTSPYAADWGSVTLPDGSIILRATATNGAGLTSQDQVTITVDTSAPEIDVTAPADGVATSDTTPNFTADAADTGSGVASVKFEYSSNGGADWVAISTDDTSPYAAGWGLVTLPDGSIILRATATNGAGLTSQDQVTITVDTSEPDIDVTAPEDGTYVPTGQPTFTAEASDTLSGIASVTFQYSSDDGASWHDISTDTNGADGFAAVWGGISLTDHAPHKLRAVATNGAGLSATSNVVEVFVDTTPPTILITAPTSGEVMNDNAPTLTAEASDDYSGVQSVLFEYSSNGGADWVAISTDDTSPYAADWGSATLPDGSIILRATATNGAGTPASDDVEIFVDTVAPGTPGEPVAGNLGDDGNWYINTLWPTFTWDASVDEQPSSGIRDYTFQFGTGPKPDPDGPDPDVWAGMLFEETNIPAGGTAVEQWQTYESIADWGVVAGEVYLARVKAYDKAGNESLWTDPSIIYDPDPPTAPGTPIATSPTNDSTPTWTWGGSTDAISGVDLYHIQIRRPGSAGWDVLDTVLDVPDSREPGDQEWEQGLQLESGTYEIRVQAMDVAGNYSAWSDIGMVLVDVNPPAVPVMAPEPEFTAGTSNTVSWSASADAETGLAGYEIRTATSENELAIAVPELEASTSKTYTGLSDGQTYYYQVRAVDNVGNASAWSSIVSSTQDASGPTTPGTPSTPSPTNDTTPTWTWRAADDEGAGVGFYYVWLTDEGGTPITGHSIGNVTTWTYDGPALTDGKYYLRVKAIDALGNDDDAWSPWGGVVIDATGPTVTAGLPPTSPTNNPRPTWTWSGDDGGGTGVGGYWVTLDGEAPIWTTDTAFTPGANLADGDHALKVKGVDVLGNEGAEITLATVTVDTTAPGVPGMPQTASPTADTTPTWTWAGVEGAASYNVYLDDEYVANVAEPSYTVADELALEDGQHYLQVSALDDLGNESAKSEAGYVVIDTTGPEAPVVTRLTPSPTNQGRQIWTWTRPADAVRYDFGESSDGETPPADPVNVGNADTYETSFTADGTHYVMVRAYDALGNVGPWSEAASVVIDMTAPGVPTNLIVPSPTADNTPTWTWTASTGDVASYEVSLDGAEAVDAGNVTTFTSSALADGVHNLRVRALDALRNASDWAGPAEVLVDTVAPVITLINPENGARLNITTASTVLAELLDSGSGVDQANVWLKIDDGEWVAPTAIVGGVLYYVVDVPFGATDDKWHSISIKARDAAGNEKKEEALFKVELYREGFGFGRLRFPEESDLY